MEKGIKRKVGTWKESKNKAKHKKGGNNESRNSLLPSKVELEKSKKEGSKVTDEGRYMGVLTFNA